MMHNFVYALTLFGNLITGAFLFDHLAKPRRRFPVIIGVWYLFMLGQYAFFMAAWEDAPFVLQTAVKVSICNVCVWVFYDASTRRKLMMCIEFFVLQLIPEIICVTLIKLLFDTDLSREYTPVNDSVYISAGRVFMNNVLLLMVLAAILFHRRNDIGKGRGRREILLIGAFDLTHFVFMLVYYRAHRSSVTETDNLIQISFQALLFIMLFIQYYSVQRTKRLMESEKELTVLKAVMENNYRYYRLADQKLEEVSRLRHDLQNHLEVIGQLIEQSGGRERAEDFVADINDKLNRITTVNYCDNKVLNALLAVKLSELSDSGISTEVLLRDCDDMGISEYDLCSLVSEMIDNAAACCNEVAAEEDRFISIRSGRENDCFVIKATASCSADYTCPESRMRIALDICRSSGGELLFERSENRFTVSAVLHIV